MRASDRPAARIGWWLAGWAVMVGLTVVIGGVTRLTESGLSITEWRPVSGVVPPIGQAAWEAEFAKYQAIPEFQLEAPEMTLDGFKRIYFWEYLHRLWARLVGAALALPLLIGWVRGSIPRGLRGRLLGLVVLVGLQGALGWYMVASGLSDRTDVSQYRLTAHLTLALVIFMVAVWTAADLTAGSRWRLDLGRSLRRHALAATAAVLLTAMAGGFVAGTNAGKVYNEFPLMAGRVVPAGYLSLSPWYRNLFDNVAAVQFNHRLLAVVLVLVVGALAVRLGRARGGWALAVVLGLVTVAQFMSGLWTLLASVPVPVAALHQGGAVVLLAATLLTVHRLSGAGAR
ncbi:MAG: COX15/CtaA family protein [Gemmatimonadales bacterium]